MTQRASSATAAPGHGRPPPLRPQTIARWAIIVPAVSLGGLVLGAPQSVAAGVVLAILLGAAIMAAVYHAEVLAHFLGEPFGTLILALAVTVIETSLIVSIMLSEGAGAQALARDTLMAAIMITINAIVGICLLVGGGRHHQQHYTQSGVSIGLAMLATLAVLTLILPNYTVSERGPSYTDSQLVFVAVISLIVYATFVGAQTIRHKEDFLHPELAGEVHQFPPVARRTAFVSGGLMAVTLVVVVLLAKALSPSIEAGVRAIGAPQALVGVIIAALVLAPEAFAALAAARANRVQTSLHLAIGSALASIGLTIPAVAVAVLIMGLDLELGLSMLSTVLLSLTLLVAALTLSTGRTTIVQGVIHLVIFATYLFTTIVP